MPNDTTTLNGALSQLGETMATNLTAKGVTANASDGLTTLAGKIANISQSGGGGATNLVQGTFTTGSSGNTNASVSLSYTGSGYPIFVAVWIDGGAYNNGTGGNTDWYNGVNRYDVGFVTVSKARTTTTPTYGTSGADNYGIICYIYKNSTSNSKSYSRSSSMTANTYTSSSTSAAASNNMIRFKGNGTTLSYYVGNRSSSTYGLARSTKYAYIVVYSS